MALVRRNLSYHHGSITDVTLIVMLQRGGDEHVSE